jgi:tetratricopeptide (TPR) repeat protein
MGKELTENLFLDASNIEALSDLRWILSNADDGFYMITANPSVQQKVFQYLSNEDIAIYDYSKTNERSYSYGIIEQWAASNSEKSVYAIINLQLALPEDKDIKNLNLSRDMLSRHNRIWIFGTTEDSRYRILKLAPDFYSFVRVKPHFIEDDNSVLQKYARIGSYDDLPFATAQEAQEFLKAYEVMENEYLSLDINSNMLSREKILSSSLTLENIAKAYVNLGNYHKAMLCLQKSLIIREKFLGEDHPDTAAAYSNIATIYYFQSEYTEACSLYLKALAVCEKVLEKDHSFTATIYNNIAGVYAHQGEYSKAHSLWQKALSIFEKLFGKDHPNTALIYKNIAEVTKKSDKIPL